MKFQRDTIYLYGPSGDVLLAEIFDDGDGTITLLLGDNRYELDRESASDLGEKLILAGIMEMSGETRDL